MTSVSPQADIGPSDRKGWAASRRWLPIVAIAGVAFLVAAAVYVPVRLTSTTSYCTSCHDMEKAHAALQKSVHRNVDCLACHVDPGLGNAVSWRIEESKNIWATYLNVPVDPMGKEIHFPSKAACTRSGCHDLSSLGTTFGNVKMDHARHVEMRGLTCIDCHGGIAHAVKGQSSSVSMTSCFMCHNGDAAPDRCSLCHVETPATASHPPDYVEDHGRFARVNEAECLRCHHDKKAFCDACHAKPTPDHYSGTWRYTHGPTASADRASCLGCHDEESFCAQCHQVDHPEGWLAGHKEIAAQGSESCLVCHPRSMCAQCHEKEGVGAP